MADKAYYLTDEDRRIIVELVRADMRRRTNTTGRAASPDLESQELQGPEVFVAKTPSEGVASIAGSAPGFAECAIYRIGNDTGLPLLEEVEAFTKVIYNVSETTIPGDTWTPVHRDKFGVWLFGGSGSGAETILVQIIGKEYDQSPFIVYTWVRVTDHTGPALHYTTENVCGCLGNWPLYHEQNLDLPVFPPGSPIERYGSIARSEEPVGVTGTGTGSGSPNPGKWENVTNIGTSNDQYVSVDLLSGEESDYLFVQGFNFCLPSAANISSVKVTVEAHALTAGDVIDTAVYLVVFGVIVSGNMATATVLPDSDTNLVYTGTPVEWGRTLHPTEINCRGDFGVALRFRNDGGTPTSVYVDSVIVEIGFTPSGGVAPHSVVRMRRGNGEYYVMERDPWQDIYRRTGIFDADGEIVYHWRFNQNTERFADGEEARLRTADNP